MAVKQGDVLLNYDTAFVFTEVNADINRWVVYPNGSRVKVYCDTTSIGTHISTKAVGSNQRVDITCNYKYPEGRRRCLSPLERPGKGLWGRGHGGPRGSSQRPLLPSPGGSSLLPPPASPLRPGAPQRAPVAI